MVWRGRFLRWRFWAGAPWTGPITTGVVIQAPIMAIGARTMEGSTQADTITAEGITADTIFTEAASVAVVLGVGMPLFMGQQFMAVVGEGHSMAAEAGMAADTIRASS